MPTHHRTPPPRAHWVLLGALLLATTALLTLHGLVLGEFHADESTPQGPTNAVPTAVRTGQAVIDPRGAAPATRGPRDHTLALTFDDGPDPTWTPKVLAVLDRYHVHATFFVTGAHAAQHPDLIREILARGNEIGNHTATHADLRDAGPTGTGVELHATDLALAGAAGVATSLVRPPYSATPDSVDDLAWQSIRRIGADGRLVVLSDLDSEDWRLPGVDKIIANATPRGGHGAVLLMHDAGGDRSQTVAALDRFVPAMQAAGWQLDTVSHTVGISGTNAAAEPQTRFGGWLLVAAVQLSDWLAATLRFVLLAASALAVLRTILVLVATAAHVRRARGRPLWAPDEPVTVIVPAYNEKAGIEATVRSVLASDHPVWVIVVDDGSTDGTAEVVERLNLRRVVLIRQANAGKPAALNAGLAAARTELVVMVDGDTVLERGTVRTVVGHFADPRVGAVSGNAKVGNRGGLLGKWQHIEYVIGFNLDRRMYDVLECMPTVPGAIGAFRRDAVLALGGMPTDTLAEDTDLTMALERDGWRVVYEQQALAWTEAPATLGQLWKQRYRWCYGTLQAVWKHRRAVVERGPAGRLGRRGIPYLLLFQVALPVLGPFVDVAAVFGIVTGDWLSTLVYWLAFLAMQVVPAIIAFRLDRERLGPLLALPLQQFVYRQLMYLVVLQSVMTALAGARLPWHKLARTGLSVPADRAST
ncbi:bifunctional polysaccharide deacetylase/glycosyltransferase family 2 protein [Kutzneria kofuensis]|uniref:Cellulose synthase/poly-beta-1,6-N-acetylglucosamine synthase-like glycosyltransferase/peptidoglycan/xylan/chitin deacetylase (PgdA/CDA1 family) n=1 Tax=Kutzneria kofuensis TaxID=103725 RepID=A0A7W9KG75_9PSEU|nr:bifunctional polysaccharide deacetylase/glycosyltransferase family 2 protein [Kutzneria kofuensis]MBB5891986.1 cellulose synthase/poly-beta-1,6-N-acetylglucosamine synthase-like glycosyltransferase/peptidoglycan/xylan/chitin deacetylase (PgdA/CDA1 family) [Kutzneria kofuensis]